MTLLWKAAATSCSPPFYEAGDITERLATALTNALHEFPELPAKFGFAVDTGDTPLLTKARQTSALSAPKQA